MSDAQTKTDIAASAHPSKVPAEYPNLVKAGRGRLPGVPNRRTIAVQDAIVSVYQDLQICEGEEHAHAHFLKWAKAHPSQYYRLFIKLLPRQLRSEVYAHSVGEVVFRGLND